MVPFLMISAQIQAVKDQISNEHNNRKYQNFCEILDTPEIQALLPSASEEIKAVAKKSFGGELEQILDLSFEQSSVVLSQANEILAFDPQSKKITGDCLLLRASTTFPVTSSQPLPLWLLGRFFSTVSTLLSINIRCRAHFVKFP